MVVGRGLTTLVFAAALFGAGPQVAPPTAEACPIGHDADPYTGQCYVVNGLPTVNGIPCIPGQSMGTCLGFLQNKPLPGGAAPPGGPWP